MANPWDNDPVVEKSKSGNPWDSDPIVTSTTSAPKTKTTIGQDIKQGIGNLAAGALRGAGSIGATLLAPVDAAARAMNNGKPVTIGDFELAGQNRRSGMDGGLSAMGAEPNSLLYQGGKLGTEIAGTLGAGGAIGNGLLRVAPSATGFANALATGGFRAGSTTGVANMLTRAGGGAVAGGASAGLINPEDAGIGATVGAALPPALASASKVAGYAGRGLNSIVQPFTAKGQEAIAGKIIRNFAKGGPTAINAAEIVPGSVPTLAEATGNAGLATLQRGARDIAPNAFAAREAANAAARNAAFDDVAGDVGKLDFFRQSRSQTGKELYDEALNADTSANFTPYVKGQITQLLKRPSIHEARKQAQQWAIERGEKASLGGNMRGLHDVKTAIDDEINVATRAGKGGQVKALEATQAKLLDVMEKLSPAYKEARLTYAAMSKPVNAMEALQGLRLTDAQGNITLAKVKNAIEGLERSQNASGISAAKSVDAKQMAALKALQADLMRQSSLGAGRSAGSNTFQNIATDNMLATFMPGKLGTMVGGKVGGLLGQVGKIAYSGPNEAIRNKLADMMLQPEMARNAFAPASPQIGSAAARFNALLDASAPGVYRAAPLLSSDR